MKKFYFLLWITGACLSVIPLYGQVRLAQVNVSYQQHFDSLANSGTTNDISTLPKGWIFAESGTNGNNTYAAGTGSSNTGNTYSFGTDASDRALGGLQSGSLIPSWGALFVNNTGSTITSITISYYGEQWRLGTAGRQDRIDFQYSLNAGSLTTGTWNDVDSLDFNSPVTTGTVGAVNGNDPANRKRITFTITGLSIAEGSNFSIRWLDFNASGADDGLAVDDFTLTPNGIPANTPRMIFTPSTLNFGDVNVGSEDTLAYRVVGLNVTDSIKIFAFNPVYTLSVDGIHFFSSLSLPDSGGVVFVRFTPTANGLFKDSLLHVSANLLQSLSVTGKGFVQSENIISITEARSKSNGTRVTVAGRITVAGELGNPAYVQDATGGIPVFFAPLANGVSIGDSVIVTGPIGFFNNQVQISGAGIFFTKVVTQPRVLEPKIIALNEIPNYEGSLVTIQNVSLVNKNFVFYPQSTEQITDGTTTVDFRIDGDTNIPGLAKPQNSFNASGVVGRFKTSYQLLPRFAADIPGASAPSAPSDSISKVNTLDIVNWNLEFFGARSEDYGNEEYGPADEALQLQNVKSVLDSLDADIIAVEEVSNDSLFHVLVSSLGKYKSTCSDRYSYSFNGPDNTFPPQKVCFIYDSTTVEALNTRVLFESLYDSARTIDGSLLPGYPGGASSFYSSGRLPYLLKAKTTINGVSEDVSLIVVHAKSGSTEADRVRRQYDAKVLKDSLDSFVDGNNIVVLGDLNDDLDVSIVPGAATPYLSFVQDTAHYVPVTKTLSDAGAKSTVSFNDVIDHQIISKELSKLYLLHSATIVTPFGWIPNYGNTTSDHLPVITRYKLKTPTVSFAVSNAVVQEENGVYQVALTLDKALNQPKTIALTLSGNAVYGADYTTSPASVNSHLNVTFAAGDTTAFVKINIVDDKLDELDELIKLNIVGSEGIQLGNPSFELVIQDNDVPVVFFTQWLESGKEGSGEYIIKLKTNTPVATSQSVTVQVFDGPGANYLSDYTTSPLVMQSLITLTIPAGSSEAQITLTPLEDRKREFPEIVSFYIKQVSAGLLVQSPRVNVFTIIDVRKELHFSIYPNPVSHWSKLICEELDESDVVSAVLYSSNNDIAYSGSGTLEQINQVLSSKLQNGKKGIYLLKISFEGETYLVRIFKI
jgi:hypothetical protein